MSIKGVIFDMDGVLVDTEPFYQKQRLEFLRRMDYVPANTEHLIGSNEPAVWAALVPDISLREKLLMGYRAFRQLHPTPYAQLMNPTAPTLLQCLRTHGIKIGLASSSVRESVDNMLSNTGIAGWIDYAVSGEECTAYKPDPEIYHRVLRVLNLHPEEALAVEDSPIGIAAARNAGLTVYALRPSEGLEMDQSAAPKVISNLHEILENII